LDSKTIDKVIEETTEYLNNIAKIYSKNLYFDNSSASNIEIISDNEIDSTLSKEKDDSKRLKTEHNKINKETVTSVDLFGNVVTQKEEWEYSLSLDEMNSLICQCQKCVLGQTRTKFVFGVGNPNSDVVLIGEAPGAEEDIQGEPFVGRAGKLLNKILEATGFKREDVYICNILKCRPPGNRNPLPEEIKKCEPYLKYQLQLIKPKIILALGKFAADTLLNLRQPLNKMRGKIHMYNGIKTMVTFHPAALLRNPQWKRPTWEDMQQFKKLYDEIKTK
jgi:uracil-DNA glycosylase family 4